MTTSKHAEKRIRQRGINNILINAVLDYGTPIPKPGNATEVIIQKKDLEKMQQELKYQSKLIDKAANIGVLTDSEGTRIITVYHRN